MQVKDLSEQRLTKHVITAKLTRVCTGPEVDYPIEIVSDFRPTSAASSVPPPWQVSLPPLRRQQWPTFALITALLMTLCVATVGWFRPVQSKRSDLLRATSSRRQDEGLC